MPPTSRATTHERVSGELRMCPQRYSRDSVTYSYYTLASIRNFRKAQSTLLTMIDESRINYSKNVNILGRAAPNSQCCTLPTRAQICQNIVVNLLMRVSFLYVLCDYASTALSICADVQSAASMRTIFSRMSVLG